MLIPVDKLLRYVYGEAKEILERRIYPVEFNPFTCYFLYEPKPVEAVSFKQTRLDDPGIEAIQRELLRLGVYEMEGFFTLLHHEGPFVEYTQNLWERVKYIIEEKPTDQILTRLKNIHRLTGSQVQRTKEILCGYASKEILCGYASKEILCGYASGEYFDLRNYRIPHRGVDGMLFREFKDHLPFCSYNGRDIF